MRHERTAATLDRSGDDRDDRDSARADAPRGTGDASVAASAAPSVDEGDERRAREVDWRTQLAGASPREVLARLIAKDSLGLRMRVASALAEHCYLLDADRVWLRAVARVARFSTRYRGEPALERWLRSQIDDAIGDCLENAEADGATERDAPSGFESLARPLGLDAARMQAACAAVNACTAPERAAFFALVIDREELDRAAARLASSPTDCARAARRALELCMRAAMHPSDASATTAREVAK